MTAAEVMAAHRHHLRRACPGQEEGENQGTLILDATCAPVNIRYPQDVSLLNEAREKVETIIYRFCKAYGLKLQRRYRRVARKDYLDFAKARKHTRQKVRKAVRKQLGYVRRDIKYLEGIGRAHV